MKTRMRPSEALVGRAPGLVVAKAVEAWLQRIINFQCPSKADRTLANFAFFARERLSFLARAFSTPAMENFYWSTTQLGRLPGPAKVSPSQVRGSLSRAAFEMMASVRAWIPRA